MKGKDSMAKTKQELAELTIRLFNNIDQADQGPDMNEVFRHLDKSHLMTLIKEMKRAVEQNVEFGKHELLLNDEDEIEGMLEEARKVLGEKDEL
jgi:hypothetical protein